VLSPINSSLGFYLKPDRVKDKVTVLFESYRFYGIKLPFLFQKVTVFGPKLPFFAEPKLPFISGQSYRF